MAPVHVIPQSTWMQPPTDVFSVGMGNRQTPFGGTEDGHMGEFLNSYLESPYESFVPPAFFEADPLDRPPSFDRVFRDFQLPSGSCTVKELAEAHAKAEAKMRTNQQVPHGIGYSLFGSQGEPAKVELPHLLGAELGAPYAPDGLPAKPETWLLEGLQEKHGSWPETSKADAESAQCALLPECLAEDVFDEIPLLVDELDPEAWQVSGWYAPEGVLSNPPTVGSANHMAGLCKPCAFSYTKGCKDGADCKFCHLCEPGEKKRRKKEKRAFMSQSRRSQPTIAPRNVKVWRQ